MQSRCRHCGPLARAIAVDGAKFVNAGSLGAGDALERYGESRRSAIVQLSPRPRVVAGRGTGMQPLRGSRRAIRLEERYGRNRCKVNDGSISPQRKPSRTLVTRRKTRAIQPWTRARSLSDSRPASPRPIVPIAKCLVPQEGAPGLGGRITAPWHVTGHCGLRDIESKFQQLAMDSRRGP